MSRRVDKGPVTLAERQRSGRSFSRRGQPISRSGRASPEAKVTMQPAGRRRVSRGRWRASGSSPPRLHRRDRGYPRKCRLVDRSTMSRRRALRSAALVPDEPGGGGRPRLDGAGHQRAQDRLGPSAVRDHPGNGQGGCPRGYHERGRRRGSRVTVRGTTMDTTMDTNGLHGDRSPCNHLTSLRRRRSSVG